MPKRIPLDERFWSKVDKNGPIPETRPDLGSCWIWTGTRHAKGYGHFRIGVRIEKAHRVAYEWLVGPIPEDLTLDHLCRVTSCVRPTHLEPVTIGKNTLRGIRNPCAINARKTHCPAGHPYDTANTMWTNKGRSRACRRCKAQRLKAWRRRKQRGNSLDMANGETPARA